MEGIENERSLLGDEHDEADTFCASFSGTLKFDDDPSAARSGVMVRDPSSNSITMPFDINSRASKPGTFGVAFEIVNACIVKEAGKSKFVSYSILVLSSAGLDVDKIPTTIDKRYTDFKNLDDSLRSRHHKLMNGISFPKKLLTGNFKPETIAQRSRAFEQYLAHLFSIDQLRLSLEFADFFYGKDVREGYRLIQNGEYKESVPLIRSAVLMQKKLQGDEHPDVIASLCALVAANLQLDRHSQALNLTETALRCIGGDNTNRYLIPLLQQSIRLCWQLGKDKKDLEARLQTLRQAGKEVEGAPSLLELVVTRFGKESPR